MLKSIQKEVKNNNTISLGKLKLDMGVKDSKNIQKTMTYMVRHLEPFTDVELLKEAIIEMLGYESENINNMIKCPIDLDLGFGGAKGLDYSNYYSYTQKEVTKNVEKDVVYYFDMNGKLPQGKNGTGWVNRSSKSKFYVFNGKRLLATYELYKRLIAVDSTLTEHKNYFVHNLMYKGSSFSGNMFIEIQIMAAIKQVFEIDSNLKLMQDYEKSQSSDYAKAFMTKKNISEKVADRMKISKFLNHGFSYLELDNQTDLEKVEQLENEWLTVYSKLTSFVENPQLRFRKLGQHKASGLYYPIQNCVCVDIRNIQSLIHELGHLYDYTISEKPLSLTDDFRPIIHSYRQYVELLDEESYVKKKSDYYLTPTEVFARAFELYQLDKIKTSFLKSEEDYVSKDEYTCFDDSNRLEIVKFFDKYLPNK